MMVRDQNPVLQKAPGNPVLFCTLPLPQGSQPKESSPYYHHHRSTKILYKYSCLVSFSGIEDGDRTTPDCRRCCSERQPLPSPDTLRTIVRCTYRSNTHERRASTCSSPTESRDTETDANQHSQIGRSRNKNIPICDHHRGAVPSSVASHQIP